MNLIKRITGYTLISVITGGTSFLLLPILTKYLSPEDYGVLSIFNASVRFFSALISLGMSYLIFVNLIKKKGFSTYLSAFIKVTFSIAFGLTLLITILSFFIHRFFGLPLYLTVLIPLIALMVLYFETFTGYFIYLKQLSLYAKSTLVKFFIEIILIIILVVLIPFNWEGRIAALLISLTAILIYLFSYFSKKGLINLKLNTISQANELIKKGIPLIFLNIAVMILNLSDRFFIEYFQGLQETGFYGLASTISGILLILVNAFTNVIRPLIYEKLVEYKTNINSLRILSINYIGGVLFFGIVLLLGSKLMFKLYININFIEALPLVYPLIVGFIFLGVYNFYISYLIFKNNNRVIGYISIFSIVLNLVLNYFLIIKFGTVGASYATMITYSITAFIVYLWYILIIKPKLKIIINDKLNSD